MSFGAAHERVWKEALLGLLLLEVGFERVSGKDGSRNMAANGKKESSRCREKGNNYIINQITLMQRSANGLWHGM